MEFQAITAFYFIESTLYLGAALSSWTQTVLTDRLSRGIKKHDSVLEVVGKGKQLS